MSDRAELHQKNLEKIFNPKSVAIVGANRVRGTVPFDILYGIVRGDFNGIIYPVSPGAKYISGIKSYKYVILDVKPYEIFNFVHFHEKSQNKPVIIGRRGKQYRSYLWY